MKKHYLILSLLLLCFTTGYAQTAYNPYVQNAHFLVPPAPAGYECGTSQTFIFTQGISTAANSTQWLANPLTVNVCLTGFILDGTILTAISGTYASNFNWTLDAFSGCLTGTQNQTLLGLASGTIIVNVKVPENSSLNMQLAANVNIQVPGYMQQSNVQADDNSSSLTTAFCSCYNFIGNPGSISGNQPFYNSGDPVAFSSITLGSGGTGGSIVYQWEELVSAVWTEIGGATNTTYDAPSTSTTRVYRRKAKRTSCGSWKNSSPVTVTITVPNAGLDKNLTCTNPSTTIGTPSIPGHTYLWSPSAGLNSATIAQPLANPTSTTNYTVTMTNSSGATASDVVVVNVNNLPPAIVTTATQSVICFGGTTTISATGANSYTWYPDEQLDPSITVTPNSTSIYTVTGIGTNGCLGSATHQIIVNPLPNVGSTATYASVCPGLYTLLSGTGADYYSWNFGATIATSILVSPPTTTTYAVIGTNSTTGCTNISIRTVSVNPLPTVSTTASPTSICSGASSTITATGSSTSYTWEPGALSGSTVNIFPTVTTTYTVTGTSTPGCTKTSTKTITILPCGSTLNLKLYIEGYYLSAGFMAPVLMNESVVGATALITDTIKVELRNTTFPYAVASSVNTILQTDGNATCTFPVSGSYYIAIKHRSAIQTWSTNPITLGSSPITYDFSIAANKAYNDNMKEVETGVWALYSGDLNLDENIDLLDLSLVETDINNFEFGYFPTDLNGDGNVDLLDSPIAEANILNFIFSGHP